MSDFVIRPWRAGDEAALKAIWKSGFSDTDAYIDAFFACFLKPGACMLAEADSIPVSAMYILDGPELHPFRRHTLKSAYTYALATLPAYRGNGLGAAVYQACCVAALEAGVDVACVLPAQEHLYPFYERAVKNRTVSSVREVRYQKSELPNVGSGQCARIEALEYAGLREAMLGGEPHASMSEEFFRWEEFQLETFGGGLFVLNGGVATAEMDGDTCRIQELILPDGNETEAAAAIAAFCPAREYIVRAPAFFEGPGTIRRSVIGKFREEPAFPYASDLWWGFSFD